MTDTLKQFQSIDIEDSYCHDCPYLLTTLETDIPASIECEGSVATCHRMETIGFTSSEDLTRCSASSMKMGYNRDTR